VRSRRCYRNPIEWNHDAMRLSFALIPLAAALAFGAGSALGQPGSATGGLPDLIKPLLFPATPEAGGAAWEDLEKDRAIRWGAGPIMLDRASPDGSFFARPGAASLAGRPVMVAATGARSMVFSVYIRDPGRLPAPDALVGDFRQAGFTVAPARCPRVPGSAAPRRWYRLTFQKKNPVFLYAGPLASGGAGYTLYFADLPAMTQAEAAVYTDDCAAGAASPGGAAPRPTTGQAGVVALIEALLRPAGAPASLPWPTLAGLPSIAWKSATPMAMTNPWSDPGEDKNPRLLEGDFKTATTRALAVATGDARGANRFYVQDGRNLPRGAVFDQLTRDGYAITALRCGKVYTQMSQAWFRIAGPGKQPAILYRANHDLGGILTEDYAVRLDNVLPPALPGQTPPVNGRCRGG
jgi:hypothetical protein